MTGTAVFGGSFNPVHVAHLALAERVRDERQMDRVLFVPALAPPHKPGERLASAADRLRMVELAVAGNDAFEASSVEIDRGGPSYTLTTVRDLRAGIDPAGELFLVLGADSVREMPTWWHARELAQEAGVIAVPRPGERLEENIEAAGRTFGQEWAERTRRMALDGPLIEVSATEIRRRLREGRSVRYLVPEAVRDYIGERGLYADGG
jgi:nicotinate-nucleotide adenylyltransferase